MTDTMNPFAATDTSNGADDLDFADPNEIDTDFARIEDLDGRTVCIFPKEILHEPKGTNGPYDKVVADVIVLDGPVFGKVTRVPMLFTDMHLAADRVVKAIRGNVGSKRPIMGKIDSKRSRHGGKAYDLKAVSADTKTQFAPAVRKALAEGIDG